jgi:hypothetical protein
VAFSHISGGEWGGVIITKFRTLVFNMLRNDFSDFWC